MKKVGVLIVTLLFLSFLIFTNLVSAADDTTTTTATTPQDKGYACLEKEVKDKCSDLGLEAQAFSLLALAYDSGIQSECEKALSASSKDNECWPSGSAGCKLKETSLAVLALENIGSSTEDAENWLLSQTKTPDLEWYLEIDSSKETTCNIEYSGLSHKITIGEDKKISGNAGGCLTSARSDYWLQIDDTCFEKNFSISCTENFITALLYKKPGDDVWHVSSKTGSAAGGGTETEKVESLCFTQNNNCNYEGSLWATLALIKTGHDKQAYLPYLIAYADDNKAFSPDAFLFYFTNLPDYLANIGRLQTQGYWNLDSPYGSSYDTALNLLALTSKTSSTDSIKSAQDWLISIQKTEGCWDSTRNTAFILYAAWGKLPIHTGAPETNCEPGNHCMTSGECTTAGGTLLTHFDCPGVQICCDKQAILQTCLQQPGEVCPSGQECSTPTIQSSDSAACCISSCQPTSTTNDCEDAEYTCRLECNSNEEEKIGFSDCPGTQACCAPVTTPTKSYWWIWLLIILIILVVLAIIFRDRLRVFIFKFKNRFKSGKAEPRRPIFPPSQSRPMISGPLFRPMQRPQSRPRPSSALDKELDETLKKLRDMGK